MTITLITGANKGLGRETARRLLEIGHTVLIGARDAERGQRTADELEGVFLKIDPTSLGPSGSRTPSCRCCVPPTIPGS